MKIFIFGAGASHGSLDFGEGLTKPPLINQLFDIKMLKKFSADNETQFIQDICGVSGLSPKNITSFRQAVEGEIGNGGSLEKWLTNMWNEKDIKNTIHGKKIISNNLGKITLYIWYLMQRVSNSYRNNNIYRLLIEKLSLNDINYGLINFNYDTLLDRALTDVGFTFSSLKDYSDANYIKPHGSVNWFYPKRGEDPHIYHENNHNYERRRELISGNMYEPRLFMSDEIVCLPKHPDLDKPEFLGSGVFSNQYGYPLILIPLTSKMKNVVKRFQDRIIKEGQDLLHQADEIFVIGYRARDDIIKQIFLRAPPNKKLNVISNGDASDIFENIASFNSQNNIKKGIVSDDGFDKFVNRCSFSNGVFQYYPNN